MTRLTSRVAFPLGAALLLATVFVAVGAGAVAIPHARIAGILLEALGGPAFAGARWEPVVVLEVRLPRVLVGALVGAGLALSGAALQGLFRNPLADPGIIGVSAGASLGAVLAMYLGLGAMQAWSVSLLAMLGAGAVASVVYAMASRGGRTPVGTLLLAGIAVGSLASALTSLVLSLALEEYEQGRQMFRWLMGGLEARTWHDVLLVAPPTLLGAAVVVASARELDALLLGETQAASMGVDVRRVRRRLIAATSAVTGAAVAVSGIIGFVGLVIPHLLRLLLGPGHGRLLPASLLYGAAFLVGADTLARTVVAPQEIRLGVMTAAVGAPFFLFLLLRRRREYTVD